MKQTKKWLSRLRNYKPADTPDKKQKAYTMPRNTGRKLGALSLMAWAGFVTLVIVATIFQPDDTTADLKPPEANKAAQVAGTDFAKRFAAEYFTWTTGSDGWIQRAERLAPYLAAGLDDQAGLITAGQEWDSASGKREIIGITETGEHRALITLEVGQVLTRETPEEGKETETVYHTFTVPVVFAGGYGVYDLPSFTGFQQQTNAKTEYLTGEVPDSGTKRNIENFLYTFFESYTTDTPDKLAYFMDTDDPQGLNGSKVFEKLHDTDIIKTGGFYEISTHAEMSEEVTGTRYLSHYRLQLTEQNGRFIVTKMNEGVE